MSDGSLSSLHSPTDEKGDQSGREAHRSMVARRRVRRRTLAFVTGMTDQELLALNEYLADRRTRAFVSDGISNMVWKLGRRARRKQQWKNNRSVGSQPSSLAESPVG